MRLPIRILALLGAVVDLETLAALHLAAAELEHQALGADALARVHRRGVAERGQRQRLGDVPGAHVEEHALHEVEARHLDHAPEAEVEPDLAKDQPAVAEVGAHHAAEDRRPTLGIAAAVALLLEDPRQLGVQALPHLVRLGVPHSRVKRLERRGRIQRRTGEDVERDIHLDGVVLGINLGPDGVLLDVELRRVRLHIQKRLRERQAAQHLVAGLEPVSDQRGRHRDVVEQAFHRDCDVL